MFSLLSRAENQVFQVYYDRLLKVAILPSNIGKYNKTTDSYILHYENLSLNGAVKNNIRTKG